MPRDRQDLLEIMETMGLLHNVIYTPSVSTKANPTFSYIVRISTPHICYALQHIHSNPHTSHGLMISSLLESVVVWKILGIKKMFRPSSQIQNLAYS